jgi:hypothetical protein
MSANPTRPVYPAGLKPREPRLIQGFRALSPDFKERLLAFVSYLVTDRDVAAACARLMRDVEGTTINTNPRDPNFFKGIGVEDKVRNLKFVAPEKYKAADILLTDVLRAEYMKIGPNPADFRG